MSSLMIFDNLTISIDEDQYWMRNMSLKQLKIDPFLIVLIIVALEHESG